MGYGTRARRRKMKGAMIKIRDGYRVDSIQGTIRLFENITR